jgi:hypothetical protein
VSEGNGKRWYDPNRLLIAAGGVVVSILIGGGGWAFGHITGGDVKNAEQDTRIHHLEETEDKIDKKLEKIEEAVQDMRKELKAGGK